MTAQKRTCSESQHQQSDFQINYLFTNSGEKASMKKQGSVASCIMKSDDPVLATVGTNEARGNDDKLVYSQARRCML